MKRICGQQIDRSRAREMKRTVDSLLTGVELER